MSKILESKYPGGIKVRKLPLEAVYIWQLPVRLFHWMNALCIVILIATGLMIAHPLAIQSVTEPNFSYWFGYVRLIHFVAAFVFFFNFLFRMYWLFAGNQFSTWNNFVLLKKWQWKELWRVILSEVLLIRRKPVEVIGHNPLAASVYLIFFIVVIIQALTGYGIFSKMTEGWFPRLFDWVVPFLGGDFAARQIHHFIMWFFILFIIVHVYLVCYDDYLQSRGEASSMIGGWKFIPISLVDKDIIRDRSKIIASNAKKMTNGKEKIIINGTKKK